VRLWIKPPSTPTAGLLRTLPMSGEYALVPNPFGGLVAVPSAAYDDEESGDGTASTLCASDIAPGPPALTRDPSTRSGANLAAAADQPTSALDESGGGGESGDGVITIHLDDERPSGIASLRNVPALSLNCDDGQGNTRRSSRRRHGLEALEVERALMKQEDRKMKSLVGGIVILVMLLMVLAGTSDPYDYIDCSEPRDGYPDTYVRIGDPCPGEAAENEEDPNGDGPGSFQQPGGAFDDGNQGAASWSPGPSPGGSVGSVGHIGGDGNDGSQAGEPPPSGGGVEASGEDGGADVEGGTASDTNGVGGGESSLAPGVSVGDLSPERLQRSLTFGLRKGSYLGHEFALSTGEENPADAALFRLVAAEGLSPEADEVRTGVIEAMKLLKAQEHLSFLFLSVRVDGECTLVLCGELERRLAYRAFPDGVGDAGDDLLRLGQCSASAREAQFGEIEAAVENIYGGGRRRT
jgi:hypothetical protein